MTEEVMMATAEATEVGVDPIVNAKVVYLENLQKEIQSLQEQMASLQYQLDIRVTAMAAYQRTLEVVNEEKSEPNGR